MYPTLLEIGPLKIHSYGLMMAIGFLVAVWFIQRDAARRGFAPKVFADMAFVSLALGIVGTRIAHIVMYPEAYSWSDPLGWIAVWRGGLVFQGAVPPVLVWVVWTLRRHAIPILPAFDIFMPWVPLGHAFGRMGCFLNGCCYGRPTDVPWAIRAPRVPWDLDEPIVGSPAFIDHLNRFSDVTHASHWSHAIHPSQLYSAFGLVILFGIMLTVRRYWNPFAGFTLPAYLTLYGVMRFIVEFYRGDHNPVHVFGLTDQQVFSLVFAAFGVVLFFILQARTRAHAAPVADAH